MAQSDTGKEADLRGTLRALLRAEAWARAWAALAPIEVVPSEARASDRVPSESEVARGLLAERALLAAACGDDLSAETLLGELAGVGAVDAETEVLALRARGFTRLTRGEADAALEALDAATSRAARPDVAPAARAEVALDAARVLLDRGGPADVSAAVGRLARARRDTQDAPGLAVAVRVELSRARALTGDPQSAADDAEVALREARRVAPELAWRALVALAEIRDALNAREAAFSRRQEALDLVEAEALRLPLDLRESFWRLPARRRLRRRVETSSSELSVGRDEGLRLPRVLDLLTRLASERDLERLLERITDAAVEISGAERGFVLLPGDEGLEPRLIRAAGKGDDPSVAFSRSLAESVWLDGAPIVTVDAADDSRLSEYLSVHRLSLRSVAALPIRGRAGTIGVLYLEHRLRRGRFSAEDVDILLAFADQAAIALENTRLLDTLAERQQALEQANDELRQANAQIEQLLSATAGERDEARAELAEVRRTLEGGATHGIIGESGPMRRLFALLARVQETSVPVVIHGESGTGKELVARAVHFGGARAKKPFVVLNCAAIPEGILESELFGHVKGAFTGADRARRGAFARADGGTLFLDEVGDMSPKMQVELLRVLQEGRVRPVGSEEDFAVDVRIVSASNKRLADEVAAGRFREDLYYRLDVVELALPPLRDRAEDIPRLANHFLAQIAADEGIPYRRLSRAALAALTQHRFPGNVRQLRHLLHSASVIAEGEVIEPADLGLAPAPEGELPERIEASDAPASPIPASPAAFQDHERDKILRALEQTGWNRAKAARLIGMPRRTFYRRLSAYGILEPNT